MVLLWFGRDVFVLDVEGNVENIGSDFEVIKERVSGSEWVIIGVNDVVVGEQFIELLDGSYSGRIAVVGVGQCMLASRVLGDSGLLVNPFLMGGVFLSLVRLGDLGCLHIFEGGVLRDPKLFSVGGWSDEKLAKLPDALMVKNKVSGEEFLENGFVNRYDLLFVGIVRMGVRLGIFDFSEARKLLFGGDE